jgi:hypothetical protein
VDIPAILLVVPVRARNLVRRFYVLLQVVFAGEGGEVVVDFAAAGVDGGPVC